MNALSAVAAKLACPVCAPLDMPLESGGAALLCPRGHSFDVARQGYVSLLTGAASKITGDTAEMLSARADFLGAGHFAPVIAALRELACGPGLILEVGAGTGYYLAALLDASPAAAGIALDVSKPAARRAARAHPRAAAIVADAWKPFPVRDQTCQQVLSVFAPRNPAHARRVLAPDGLFVVVTPGPRHLAELVAPLGMVSVDPAKPQRLDDAMSGLFRRVRRRPVEFTMALGHTGVRAVVAMGPSAHHGADGRADRIARLPDPISVTGSVVISVYEALR